MPPPSLSGLPPSRVLALDLGSRRIGIAITDPLGILALPLLTLAHKSPHLDRKAISRLIRKHDITDLVVGDPVHLSGELSSSARKARAFTADLHLHHPELRIHPIDERYTTAEAHTLLDRSGRRVHSRADRLARERTIDQIAAVLLLEAFLSLSSPALLPPPPGFDEDHNLDSNSDPDPDPDPDPSPNSDSDAPSAPRS